MVDTKDDKTKLTPEQEQAKREEDAAVERARKDLEDRKAKINQPYEMGQLAWLNTPEGRAVLEKNLGKRPGTQEDYPCPEGMVTVVVPRGFRLMLDHHHVFDVPAGVIEMPAALANHHTVTNHGVQAYTRAAPARPVAAMTSTKVPDPVTVSGRTLPQQNYANAALALSGLTVEDWNKLPDEERGKMISAEVAKAEAASATPPPKTESSKPVQSPPFHKR